MPPPPGSTSSDANSKKKKKGRPPAHQNKFAFKHNPKSKTTAKILSSPNVHVCRRCHEKIEWRKQYRKYKPLTQPSTCNGCKKRNVLAAYHTICESCTRTSDKAKEIIAAAIAAETTATPDTTKGEGDEVPGEQEVTMHQPKLRACAMCVKEIALPDSDDEDGADLADDLGRIRLRERRTLERKQLREEKEARRAARAAREDNKEGDDNSEDDDDDNDDDINLQDLGDDDDEDDPFLKAVGGADKLLTGKAYQEKLLAEQR